MYHKIGTSKQYQELKKQVSQSMPEKVWNTLADRIKIMDNYYGKDRDIEKDMGGYCVIFPSGQILDTKEYDSILNKYHLQQGEWEYQEQIVSDKVSEVWIEELYLAGSDYGIVLFYPLSERQV